MNNGDTVKVREMFGSKVEGVKGKTGEITGIGTFQVKIEGETYHLEPSRLALVDKGVESKMTYKQACELTTAMHKIVVQMLKRGGVDPYSQKGYAVLGDPADWGKDIGRSIFETYYDIGLQIVHIDGENR